MQISPAINIFLSVVLCLGALLSSTARALDRSQIAIVVNTMDPLSVQIGDYYAAQRRIFFQNIIRVAFPPGRTALTSEEFGALKQRVDEHATQSVQAYALTWAAPYRVECMSMTSAFAFGFDPKFCAKGCTPTPQSPYYRSPVRLPYTQLGVRPTMAIAATTFERAKALIDRGVRADGLRPAGTAYLVSTSDADRNVREASYPQVERLLAGTLRVRRLNQTAPKSVPNVLFYFTGAADVQNLPTLRFVPGAIADHLTSFGGQLTDSHQMSALRWLEAGATGSYGTVVEPCNIPQKFPDPPSVIHYYLQGETLIEAYWKSVLMPAQGIFVGEPLAAPFRRPNALQGATN